MNLLTIALAALAAVISVPAESLAQNAPIPGTITVEPLPEAAGSAEARQHFTDAVANALNNAGFLALPGDARGRYVARLTITRKARGQVAADGVEAGAGIRGVGFAVTLPSNKTQLRALIVTELQVDILPRDGTQPVWSGSALTVQAQGTAEDAPENLAPRLADAAVGAFPQERTQPVSVP